jgi:hypothetical protein
MSVAIWTGALSYARSHDPEAYMRLTQEFERINSVLRDNGLNEHHEPEVIPEEGYCARELGLPYSWLHRLRRSVAYSRTSRPFAPLAVGADASKDEVLDEEQFGTMESHVICHSDSQGYYVPIAFDVPLFDSRVVGGMLGSCQGCVSELLMVAPLLQINVREGGSVHPREVAAAGESNVGTDPLGAERRVWAVFYEVARMSLEYKTAIVFS